MTTTTSPLTGTELFRCIGSAIAEARETLHYEGDKPVTFLYHADIERCFDDLSDAQIKFTWATEIFDELVSTLRLAVEGLNTAPRFRVGDTDSYRIAAQCDRSLARARGK